MIADYDPAWPRRFLHERDRIRAAMGGAAVRIEHIGSTSVPGLAAKPIVDVLVTVSDPEADELIAPALEAAGYELRVREAEHRMFRTPARDVQVHVWADGDSEVDRYLIFRDRLRDSPERRRDTSGSSASWPSVTGPTSTTTPTRRARSSSRSSPRGREANQRLLPSPEVHSRFQPKYTSAAEI